MGNADLEIALKSAEGIVNQGLNYLRKKDSPEQRKLGAVSVRMSKSSTIQ